MPTSASATGSERPNQELHGPASASCRVSQLNEMTSSVGINIIATAGGRFDIPNQTAPTSASVTGSGHIQFTRCTTATLNYPFNDGRVGTIPLSRVGPAPGPC